MTRCYLDTNFVYAHLRVPAESSDQVDRWRQRVLAELDDDRGVISALVIDELAYRLILAWLRDDGVTDPLARYRSDPQATMRAMRRRLGSTWHAVDALNLELQPTDRDVVDAARRYMAQPGLAPRDAFHAAHAVGAECAVVVSSDPALDAVPSLRRLGP